MTRPRLQRNRSLPDNLYTQVINGTTYFRYRNPKTKQTTGMGTDRRQAMVAARMLNARLTSSPSAEDLVARVIAPATSVAAYVQTYKEHLALRRNRRGKPLAPSTLSEYIRYLNLSAEHWGQRPLHLITRLDVSELLGTQTPNSANHLRSVLHGMFAHAIAEGHLESNPVEGTLKPTIVVQRTRLTEAQYSALRAKSPEWLQIALDLALESLQRREDLVRLTADDIEDGYLYVRQQKTGVNVRMPLSEELGTKLPKTGTLIQRNGKPVKQDYLTRAFSKARDEVPELSAQPLEQRPTLHELRALGARILEKRGVDPQKRLGHLESKTTRLYLDRHKERWIDAE